MVSWIILLGTTFKRLLYKGKELRTTVRTNRVVVMVLQWLNCDNARSNPFVCDAFICEKTIET